MNRPERLRGLGEEVVDGLEFDTDEEVLEACNRCRDITKVRRQEKIVGREREAKEEVEGAKQLKVKRCNFCMEPSSPTRMVVIYEGCNHICEVCVAEIAEFIAARKAKGSSLVKTGSSADSVL